MSGGTLSTTTDAHLVRPIRASRDGLSAMASRVMAMAVHLLSDLRRACAGSDLSTVLPQTASCQMGDY